MADLEVFLERWGVGSKGVCGHGHKLLLLLLWECQAKQVAARILELKVFGGGWMKRGWMLMLTKNIIHIIWIFQTRWSTGTVQRFFFHYAISLAWRCSKRPLIWTNQLGPHCQRMHVKTFVKAKLIFSATFSPSSVSVHREHLFLVPQTYPHLLRIRKQYGLVPQTLSGFETEESYGDCGGLRS